MTEPKSIVVPDLHGCPQFLEWVLETFVNRSLIFLGDLIHRGPDSRFTLLRALELAEEGRAVLLWGNHEHWAYTETINLSEAECVRWFQTEGRELLQAYGGKPSAVAEVRVDLARFAQVAKPYHVEGKMMCAHASRPSLGLTLEDVLDNGYLSDRPALGLHPLPIQFFPELTYSVHGHTVVAAPVIDLAGEGVVYIDLGSSKTSRFCVWDAELQRVFFYNEDEF
ncbi:MAG: hypothetical protein JWQ08_2356 [Deinococcus sp.]|nr:hypothetical protein [Deinococcus sp.]